MTPLPFDLMIEARRQWRAHWGRTAAPSMAAVTSVMRAEQIMIARLNELLRPWNLTFPRYEGLVLLFYSRNGSARAGTLPARAAVAAATAANEESSHRPVRTAQAGETRIWPTRKSAGKSAAHP